MNPESDEDFLRMHVDFDFLLRLHAHALMSLTDGEFTGRAIRCLERKIKKQNGAGLVYQPQKIGVAHFYAERAIDSYFNELIDFGYIEYNGYHNVFQTIEALRAAWFTSSRNNKRLKRLTDEINILKAKADTSELEDWCNLAIDDGGQLLWELATS